MFPKSVESVIQYFQMFPGVGEKTATRFALYVLRMGKEDVRSFARSLEAVKDSLRLCSACFQMTDDEVCSLCSPSSSRDHSVVCVVEDQQSLMAMERSQVFKGVYHVLGGHLSPMDGISAEDLRIEELLSRIQQEGSPIREVILATNPNSEGEATAHHLSTLLRPLEVRVTRIARGVPMGGEIEYTDAATLEKALSGRASC